MTIRACIHSTKVKVLILLVALSAATLCQANKTHIAVASNFMVPMKEIIASFEAQSGYRVSASYASSGAIYAQIVNGAPFDVFFSADQEKPQRLVIEGLADEQSRKTYALGGLALWSNKHNIGSVGPDLLSQQGVRRIALANPRFAPYGMAAMDVLRHFGLADQLKSKFVLGENISHVYQFVESTNVDVGFVALSQVVGNRRLQEQTVWRVPPSLHKPIKQDLVKMNSTKNSLVADRLLRFMSGDTVRAILERYAYTVPDNDKPDEYEHGA